MKTSQQRSKIDGLHRRIGQIDEAAAQLAKERAKLIEELNDVEPPISLLPPEVLCLIFHFARPSGFSNRDSRETALFCRLILVSKHWRSVLLSNPAIWTEVDLLLSNNPRRNVNPLMTFIKYSGQLPLSLGIEYPSIPYTDNTALIHPIVDSSILEGLGRVTRLHLINPSLEWFYHQTHLQQITHLTLCNIYTSNYRVLLLLDQAISLTVRDSPGIRLISAPLITTLNLNYMPISSCFFIITKCPNLKKLQLSSQETHGDADAELPSHPFTLPHLETLHWTVEIYEHNDWYTAVLNHIRLPFLQTLEWEQNIIKYPVVGRAIADFFRRLPTTLTFLRFLHLWIVPGREDIHLVPPIDCHLESIEFNKCSIRFFLFFLQKLQTMHRLPRLHTIKTVMLIWTRDSLALVDEEFALQMKEDVSRACLSVLQNCMNVSGRRFTLILEKTEIGWWEKVQEGLVEFKLTNGCQVAILRTGCTIVLDT